MQRFMVRYYGLSLSEVSINELLGEVFRIANYHRIQLPADFALLGRTAAATGSGPAPPLAWRTVAT